MYTFSNWSAPLGNAGPQTIAVPSGGAIYSANFSAQYLLTTSASPPGQGTIAISPTSANGYYLSGTSVQLTATPSQYYTFNWSGDLSGTTNPQTVVMSAPHNVTANFAAQMTSIVVTTNPSGRTISVDNVVLTAPQTFKWNVNSTHTIAVANQTSTGTRYTFSGWSNGGSASQTISVPSTAPAPYTADFQTEFLLTTFAGPTASGHILAAPASPDFYYAAGTSVQLTATPLWGYQLAAWSGDLTGTTNPQTVVMSKPLTVTATFAHFVQQGTKLVGAGAVGSAFQGSAVALSANGNTLLVGGMEDNAGEGAAWVFTRSGGAWTQQGAKLIGSGGGKGDAQGSAVALSADGNTAIVGGPDYSGGIGAAWVFTRSGNAWSEQGRLYLATAKAGYYGTSVALSADGNTAVIGCAACDPSTAPFVWVRSAGQWIAQYPLGPIPGQPASYGRAVALSADGSTAIVGGPDSNSGAWVWVGHSSGVWTGQGKLFGTGDLQPGGSASQGSAVALSADGSTAIVGASSDDSGAGAVWIFTRSENVWTQQDWIVGSNGIGSSYQGSSVAISGDGNTIMFGGPGDNGNNGAAWILEQDEGFWGQIGPKIIASGASGSSYYGYRLALSADGLTAAVGGDTDSNNTGAVWVYTGPITTQTLTTPTVQIESPSPGSSASGTIAISGWAIDNTTSVGTSIGSVQVFVDGMLAGNATYGSSRPDVCTAYPGRPGCPNVGFSFGLNAGTLSAGAHTITVSATDTDMTPDTGSSSVTVNVTALPTAHIESPLAGSVVSGTTTVSGWAIDNASSVGTAIGGVNVLVDGVIVGSATYGINRPDVCAVYAGRPGCPNVGFTYALDTTKFAPGTHTITVQATDTDGTPGTGSVNVTVTIPTSPPAVYIDSPAPGAVVSGVVPVTGWTLDSTATGGSAIASVQVKVDGTAAGTATYGSSRPDVCAAYPGRPGCPNVGFTYQLNTGTLTPGTHLLTVSATDSNASPDTGSWSISIQVNPVNVHIDSPQPGTTVSGAVTLAGWALDNISGTGVAISSVQVKVDGNVVGNATYGSSRPDVCAVYTGRPGCPNVGFTYSLNTASLSLGQHTITVSATDTNGTPDTNAASVTVTVVAIPPTVHIDSPVPGSMLSGTATLSGWAVDNSTRVGTAIASVLVSVDGTPVGSATYGVNRADVCSAYPGRPGCPNVGFTYPLNLVALSPGPHTITVSATDTDGTPDVGTANVTITVANASPSAYIDSPSSGAVVSGTVTVSGWALDNTSADGTAINNVQVKVDGVVVGTAIYGTSRADVCSAYPGRPGCPNVGFTYALNTAALTQGSHLLTVSATDSDASPDSGSWSITIQVAAPPSVYIDSPANGATVSGMVTVSGWAVDNTSTVGTAISRVQIKMDGVTVGNATYGLNRSDVCAVYAGRPGCPNVGYSFVLNAAALSPGSHTLTVIATDTDGTPDTGSASITIIR